MDPNNDFIFKDQIKVIRKLVARNTVFSPEQVVHNDFAKFEKVVPKHSILYKMKSNNPQYDLQRKTIFTPDDRDLFKENLMRVYEYGSPDSVFSKQDRNNFENLNEMNYLTLNTVDKNYRLNNYVPFAESTNGGKKYYRAKAVKKINEGERTNNASSNNKKIPDSLSPLNFSKNFNYLEYNSISPVFNNNSKHGKKDKNFISQPQISTQFNSNSNIINIENNIFGYSEYDKKNRLSTDLRSSNNNYSEYSNINKGNTQSRVCLNEYGSENSSEYFEKMKPRNVSDSYKKYSEKMQIYRKKLAIEFLKHFKMFLAYYLQRLFMNLIDSITYNTNKRSKKYLKTEGNNPNDKYYESVDRNKFYKIKNYSKVNLYKPRNILIEPLGSKNISINSYKDTGNYTLKTFDIKNQKFNFTPYKKTKMLSFCKVEDNSKIQIRNGVLFKNNSLIFDEGKRTNELYRNFNLLVKKHDQISKRKKNKNSLPKITKYFSLENSTPNLRANFSRDKKLNDTDNNNENGSYSYIKIRRNNIIKKNVNNYLSKEYKKEPLTNQNYSKISVKFGPNMCKESQSSFKINKANSNININKEIPKTIKEKARNSYNYKKMNILAEKNKGLNLKKIQHRLTDYSMSNKVYKVLVKNINTSDNRLHIHINYYFLPQNKTNNAIKYDNITKYNSCSLNFIKPNINLPIKRKKNNNVNNRLSLIREEDPSIRDSKVFEENEFGDVNNYKNELSAKNAQKNKNLKIIDFCDIIYNLLIKKYRNDFFDKIKKDPRNVVPNELNVISNVQLDFNNVNNKVNKNLENKIYIKKRRTDAIKKKNPLTIQKLCLFRDLLRSYALKKKNK